MPNPYRNSAKPKVRRTLDLGVVRAVLVVGCVELLLIGLIVCVVALVVAAWHYAFTHIGSPIHNALFNAWFIVCASGVPTGIFCTTWLVTNWTSLRSKSCEPILREKEAGES